MRKNKTSTFLLAWLAVLCSTAVLAMPVIDQGSVTLVQNPRSRLVTVQYVLTGDPAVVTVDFQTNNLATGTWASIGGEKYARVSGDVNKLVTNVNSTCTMQWKPNEAGAWPNQIVANGNFRAVVKAWATNAPPPYMIVDLQDKPGETRYYPSAEAIPFGITNDLYKTTRLAFRLVPAALAQYRMGSPSSESGRTASREPQHRVMFTNDWYMGVYPVTQGQNKFFGAGAVIDRAKQLPSAPSLTTNTAETATFPVEGVLYTALRGYGVGSPQTETGSWPADGHEVSSNSGLHKARTVTGLPSLDLPTEAMWEYTCRAGTTTATYEGDITVTNGSDLDSVLDEIAWYTANSGNVTHPVGLKKANPWGFYDMLGNVSEWCLDKYDVRSGQSGRTDFTDCIDPPGPADTGTVWPCRSIRGGSYLSGAYTCRSACRDLNRYSHDNDMTNTPYLKTVGYRLCCDAVALK